MIVAYDIGDWLVIYNSNIPRIRHYDWTQVENSSEIITHIFRFFSIITIIRMEAVIYTFSLPIPFSSTTKSQ